MKHHIYQKARFLKSAAKLEQLPADEGIEVAFVGRSNVGKSSAINAITTLKNLAKTSKTPGRTQLINLFELDAKRRLVDLPGYGFAQVPKAVKENWEKTLAAYLEQRTCLKGLVLLVDIRHLLKPVDISLLNWAGVGGLPVHILLTKADKLGRGKINEALHILQKNLLEFNTSTISIQPFSISMPDTLDTARQQLNAWFDISRR